jgi:hypothetical protein
MQKRSFNEWIDVVAAGAPLAVGACIAVGLVFLIFVLLAGGSAAEKSNDKKARVLTTEGISEATYDSLAKDFGSYDDYKRALEKGMNARQYARYRSQKEACIRNWSSCSDNAQLASDWLGWARVQAECKLAGTSAQSTAPRNGPGWPSRAFSRSRITSKPEKQSR